MSGSTRLLAPKRNLCILYCLPFCASVLDAVIFNTSIVEYKKPNDNTKTKKILKNISILTPEMQLPPSSGVSSIPFPLCTLFEGTHGTALRGGGHTTRLTQSVTIAIPSLRSLRHAHRKVSFLHYATRSPTKRTTLVGSLVLFVKLGARCGRRLAPPRYE